MIPCNTLWTAILEPIANNPLLSAILEPIRHPDASQIDGEEALSLVLSSWEANEGGPRRVKNNSNDARSLMARHGLGPLWLDSLKQRGLDAYLPEETAKELKDERNACMGYSLFQERALAIAAAALESAQIPYVVIKGAHLRRVLYRHPALRPAADVDLLVPMESRHVAVEVLSEAGFVGKPPVRVACRSSLGGLLGARTEGNRETEKPRRYGCIDIRTRWSGAKSVLKTISHEIPMQGHGIWLDVHWRLFRPGRSRFELGESVLFGRRLLEDLWVPDPLNALILMILHPAITDHVTGRLIRAVDIDRWARTQPCPWEEFTAVAKKAGLAGAAWAMLTWTRHHLGTPIPEEVDMALRPGALRRAYILAWLGADPSGCYPSHPNLVRGAFSLSLQDSPLDSLRALRTLWKLKQEALQHT